MLGFLLMALGWPYRVRRIFHPDSPGVKVDVAIMFPRYLWNPEFATNSEVLRYYRLRNHEKIKA
jgi:hypothetical protein